MKKKVALHCIKNNLSDYFISNELHKERLFSDHELIKFSSNYLNQNNIKIEDISTEDGDLEDVFVQLTKH